MFNQMILFTLAMALSSFVSSVTWAEVLTGKQCRDHLSPITQYVVNRSMAPQFNEINGEIPNMMGIPLSQISKVKGESPLVQYFTLLAHHTVTQCEKNCSGIRNRDGNLVSCSELGKKSILDIYHKIDLIDENSIAEVTFTPNPECAFNAENVECQTNPTDLKDKVADNTNLEDKANPAAPEVTPLASQTDSQIMDRVYWQDARTKFLNEREQKTNEMSVY